MEQSRSVAVTPIGTVAVVAHDAGGAEILSSWARRYMTDGVAVLGGPATKIFNGKMPDVARLDLVDAIRQCDWVLVGTGSSDFEYEARLSSLIILLIYAVNHHSSSNCCQTFLNAATIKSTSSSSNSCKHISNSKKVLS